MGPRGAVLCRLGASRPVPFAIIGAAVVGTSTRRLGASGGGAMDRAVDTPYEAFTRDRAYQAGIDHLVRFAGIPPAQVVMDLGGGTGAMSLAVLERSDPAGLIIV